MNMTFKFRRIRAIVPVVAALALVAAGQSRAGQVDAKISTQVIKKLCSDFKTTLDLQKSDTGAVTMTARICNEGPGGYVSTANPLDGYFMVYTWHPPKTPAQEANLKFYQHTDLGTAMKAGECKSIQYRYQIENFSRWGTFPTSATERQAMKQICARVERRNGPGFTLCEDSIIENTTACIDVPYMEKIK